MIHSIIKNLLNGDKRTVLLKKNIYGSFLIKGWSCFIQLLLVPMTLNCLNKYEYGIWLTINSILIWVDSFDIGLGNGLRNCLARSIAQDDKERGRIQVSTAFVMLLAIMSVAFIIIFVILDNTDCNKLLNVSPYKVPNLKTILMISFAMVCVTFVFKIVGNVYMSLQLPAINNLLIAVGQTLSFIGIFILSFFGKATLLQVALIYTFFPLLVYMMAFPVTFSKYKYLRPVFNLFDKNELVSLFSLGIEFFFVQIGALILFASSNILISHLFSPQEVTPYQISYRYYGLTNILFTIISAPLWTATTDAYTKGDLKWIVSMVMKMKKVMLFFFIILIIMVLVADYIYELWVGSDIHIPFVMSVVMAAYMAVVIYGTCYSNILCGIGKIRLITTITIIEAFIYIPLAIYMGKQIGIVGIIVALITVNAISAIVNKIQFEKITKGKAKGIWNK